MNLPYIVTPPIRGGLFKPGRRVLHDAAQRRSKRSINIRCQLALTVKTNEPLLMDQYWHAFVRSLLVGLRRCFPIISRGHALAHYNQAAQAEREHFLSAVNHVGGQRRTGKATRTPPHTWILYSSPDAMRPLNWRETMCGCRLSDKRV